MIIWLASYPRSGNSLFANLVAHHLGVSSYSIYKEADYVAYTHLNKDELRVATKSQDVFFVKTHEMPEDDLPAIYLVRDGLDSIISFAHYIIDNKINIPVPPPENLLTWVLDSLINSSDQFGGWGAHVQAWTKRSAKTVVVRYENLLKSENQLDVLTSTLEKLGQAHFSVVNTSPLPDFSNYHRQNPNFYRKGESGVGIAEIPASYYLQFQKRYGDIMQELGYGNNSILGKGKVAHYQSNQKLTLELLEVQKNIEQKERELVEKERIIQNFRQSLSYSLTYGPFRYIPLLGKIGRFLARLNVTKRLIFLYRLGILYQYAPRTCDIPASYFRVKKLLQPAPTISIVTPTYNYARFIERTMKSVIYQGYPKLEYIVQDGGSTDDTAALMEKFKHHLKHFESCKDNGQTHAINLGFRYASGEIMAYLNSDDVLLPGTLDFVANYFSTHPEVDIVYGHRLIIDENDKVIGDWIMPSHESEALRWADYIPQETLFWRRSIWEKVGAQMDESFQFAMDWDLLLRFQEAGALFKRLPRILAAFRVHEQQKTSAQITNLGEEEVAQLRLRNFGRQVDNLEISSNLRKYLGRSIWWYWMHKLEIKKHKYLAYWHHENEPAYWYGPESAEEINLVS